MNAKSFPKKKCKRRNKKDSLKILSLLVPKAFVSGFGPIIINFILCHLIARSFNFSVIMSKDRSESIARLPKKLPHTGFSSPLPTSILLPFFPKF